MFASEMMKTVQQNSDQLNADGWPNAYWGNSNHWYQAIGTNRDADDLTRANWQAFKDNLPDEDGWQVESASHWACGWVEHILIDPSCLANVVAADEMLKGLQDYPID